MQTPPRFPAPAIAFSWSWVPDVIPVCDGSRKMHPPLWKSTNLTNREQEKDSGAFWKGHSKAPHRPSFSRMGQRPDAEGGEKQSMPRRAQERPRLLVEGEETCPGLLGICSQGRSWRGRKRQPPLKHELMLPVTVGTVLAPAGVEDAPSVDLRLLLVRSFPRDTPIPRHRQTGPMCPLQHSP